MVISWVLTIGASQGVTICDRRQRTRQISQSQDPYIIKLCDLS